MLKNILTNKLLIGTLCSLLIISLASWLIWQNNSLVITKFSYTNAKIPASFNGYKILQISDLHNKEFGSKQQGLLAEIVQIKPDLIVITGDLIDRNSENFDGAIDFIQGAVAIAPVYYVTGNHEAGASLYPQLLVALRTAHVNLLDDRMIKIAKGDEIIEIFGIGDPTFALYDYADGSKLNKWQKKLEKLTAEGVTGFRILLSHRPELFTQYAQAQLDLVFTGHAHGGQVRIPLIGALVAPNQGFFPKYASGIYHSLATTMVVSRGLGNSIFPLRIFNRPEIVVVTIYKQ